MTRENVMSTPIFDQLLREMAQRADPDPPPPPEQPTPQEAEQPPRQNPPRRRHRAD